MAGAQASALRAVDVAAFHELQQARDAPEKEGRSRFEQLSAEVIAAFKSEHADWLERADEK